MNKGPPAWIFPLLFWCIIVPQSCVFVVSWSSTLEEKPRFSSPLCSLTGFSAVLGSNVVVSAFFRDFNDLQMIGSLLAVSRLPVSGQPPWWGPPERSHPRLCWDWGPPGLRPEERAAVQWACCWWPA